MRKLILLFLITAFVVSCSIEQRMHKNPVLKNRVCSACGGRDTLKLTEKDTFIQEFRDTLIESLPDTASLNLLLRCDSLGNVYIAEMSGKDGRITYLKSLLKNNLLNITAIKQHEKQLVEKVKELERRLSLRKEKQTTYIELPVPYIPWWVKWFLYPLSVIGAIASLYAFIKWGIPLILKAIRKGTIGI
jgi:hypothetical protein